MALQTGENAEFRGWMVTVTIQPCKQIKYQTKNTEGGKST